MLTAEILSQGDEVVTGQTIDTNAAWLAARLTELGFTVVRHTTVGDVPADIRAMLSAAAERAELVISTGGLGPTDDDLTAEAVAAVFARPLALDTEAMRQIEAMYARFGRHMPEVNRKQALLPEGALRLDNAWGTAPGFAVDAPGTLLAFLPGVPREMRAMFEHRVLPLVRERFALRPGRLVTLRTTGVGESDLQERIGPFTAPDVVLGYRSISPENQVKLRFAPDVAEDRVRALVDDLAARIGTPLFAIDGLDVPGGSLAEVVGHALRVHGATLAVAESCTGGRLSALCTAVPGASAWFLEGLVTYANASKIRHLGVDADTLGHYGAVSAEVSQQMARGVREGAGATYGLGITGIAGPDGGTDEKPVGTVHIALAAPGGVHHRKLRLAGDRERIQNLSAAAALDLLRRKLHEIL